MNDDSQENKYNLTQIGNKIKYLREKNNLKKSELASKISVSRNTIGSFENNIHYPSADCIIKLCKLFNVSADYLLSLDEDELNISKDLYDLNLNFQDYLYVEGLTKKQLNHLKESIEFMKEKKE